MNGRLHEVFRAAIVSGMLDLNIRQREHPNGEVFRRCPAALLVAGIKTNLSFLRNAVFRNQSFRVQPFSEVLAHACFFHPALQGQFAGFAGPLNPGMGRQIVGNRSVARKWCPQVVPAQNHNLLKSIWLRFCRLRLRTVSLRKAESAAQNENQYRQNRNNLFHPVVPPSLVDHDAVSSGLSSSPAPMLLRISAAKSFLVRYFTVHINASSRIIGTAIVVTSITATEDR